MKNWTYRGKDFNPDSIDSKEFMGFVYIIRNHVTGLQYVGKKLFFFKGHEKVLLKNGKKKKKRCLVESDWKTYFGSSAEFSKNVAEHGEDSFDREILHLCSSKAEISYLEAYEQFTRNVLLDDSYQNGWVMVRVRKAHMVKIRQKILESIKNEN